MDEQREHAAEENKRLQRCINDLIGVLALPAMWSGGEPCRIAHTLLDSLLPMLRLDLVYVRLTQPVGEEFVEMIRIAQGQDQSGASSELCKVFRDWSHARPEQWPPRIPSPVAEGELAIVPLRLGVDGELGLIVAGSYRSDFPAEAERLVLSVAVGQAAIGMKEARLLNEQRRIANELDQRVAQRTAQLAAANEDLRREVGERRRAEAALRQSEARLADSERDLQLTIDTIPVFVATYRPDGTRSFVNRTWQEYMGLTMEEATSTGAKAFPHFHPGDAERNDKAWRASLESGEPLFIEVRVRRADGQYRWHTSHRVPLRDENGDVVKWYSVGIDIEDQKAAEDALRRSIDERKQVEEKLRRSEAFLAEAQRLSSTGGFAWRVETGEITWSEQLYRIFEFDALTPITLERIRSRVHPDDILLLNEVIDWARSNGRDFEYEHRLQMPDGSIKHLHLVAHGMRDEQGRLEYIGAVQDVTQRRLYEEALNKARSEFAHVARVTSLGALTASIAHEVNQPLSGIINNAGACLRMLAADPPNIDGARETTRRTLRDGNRASEVITRLRTLFSKKDAVNDTVDLNEATREVVAMSLSELQGGRVVVRSELADDLPPVAGDRVQLQQVILNLLLNAADAMSGIDDRPRQVAIRTQRDEGDAVRLSVQDLGVGLDPQSMDKLFEAFYTTKSNGMGIGLSVSRSIIERHHGRLWAAPNDGPGATFSFSIPSATGGDRSPSGGANRTFARTDALRVMNSGLL